MRSSSLFFVDALGTLGSGARVLQEMEKLLVVPHV